MDVAYLAWKAGAWAATPSNALALLVCSLLLMFAREQKRLQAGAGIVLALLFALFSFSPLPAALMRTLERRFPAFDPEAAQVPPSAIVILGGGAGRAAIQGRPHELLNDAADRLRHGAELARLYTGSQVYVLGGEAFELPGGAPEADVMNRVLVEFGVDPARIVREGDSRTTAENARALAALPETTDGAVLLVTSAFHMPRSMAAFRAACINVIAAPTDWRAPDHTAPLASSASQSLAMADIALKEALGLAAYRLTGAGASLWPDPEDELPERCV